MRRLSNPLMKMPTYWWDLEDRSRRFFSADERLLHSQVMNADPDNTPTAFDDFYRLMIHRMCAELHPGMCTGEADGEIPVRVVRDVDIRGWLKAVAAVAKSAAFGSSVYVSKTEAGNRAAICSQCPENKQGICVSCNGLRALTKMYTLWRTTPFDRRLGVCGICGCMLSAKVWVPSEILDKLDGDLNNDTGSERFPDRCWRRSSDS